MKKKFKIILIVAAIIMVGLAGCLFINKFIIDKNNSEQNETSESNPISFFVPKNQINGYDIVKLKEQYPDIVSWIEIPNTGISSPVCQHSSNDFFYLNHNNKGELDRNGALYIEKCNKANYSDPVTVIYGHNMLDGTVFSNLHYFENTQFFNDNPNFYIYIDGHKLTYTVASAYAGSDAHIINNHDFNDSVQRNKYFNEVINPKSYLKNTRSGIEIKETDKIVQLSTCMSDLSLNNQRYIVTGVLTNDESTI